MGENGSNWQNEALPSEESHPEFEALCALAPSGSLSADEQARLLAHLSGCDSCRRILAQYEAIAGEVIPALAKFDMEHDSIVGPNSSRSSWSLEGAEAVLFSRLDEEEEKRPEPADGLDPVPPSEGDSFPIGESFGDDTLWRQLWWQYAAALVLFAALAFSVYRLGLSRGTEIAERNAPRESAYPILAQSTAPNQSQPGMAAPSQSMENDKLIAVLRAKLDQQSTDIIRLKAAQAAMSGDLAASAAAADRLSRERADLAEQLAGARLNLGDLQQKLDAATTQTAESTARATALDAKVAELSDRLHERDQESAQARELLDHDRDIRDLMGARDLYIAEVYDVAKTGDTEKPFGRVFYTKGKSLIFYAYDLDEKAEAKTASTFEAWGRRGPTWTQAVKLGVLYEDNASKKRWVVKSNDPRTLSQIDAVFVTVEPNGGSTHPSGKPFLFAYLRVESNHP